MAKAASTRPVRVCIPALAETTPTSLYGVYEVLSSVGRAWPQITGKDGSARTFDVSIVSIDGGSVVSALGIPVTAHAGIGDVTETDVIVVTDLDLANVPDLRTAWPEMADWARRHYQQGAMLCSVCTGAVLLARAGILDGLEATTHWSAAGLFAENFPRVRLRPERILLPAGPEHRVVTGGGASSWEELALHLIARFCGREEAIRTAKIFLFGDRSEGQLPYAAMGRPRRHDDGIIARCQSWVARNYDHPSPVNRMIALSGLAARTFKRRFKAATGYTPIEYVQTLRIEEAKQLLESTELAIEAIAHEVGYGESAFFHRLFKRCTGTTPAKYRRRFESIRAD